MLQTPLTSLSGEPGNPIGLTDAEPEDTALLPSPERCYMVTGDKFEEDECDFEEEY